LISIISH